MNRNPNTIGLKQNVSKRAKKEDEEIERIDTIRKDKELFIDTYFIRAAEKHPNDPKIMRQLLKWREVQSIPEQIEDFDFGALLDATENAIKPNQATPEE